jgi:stress response protein YsnF
MAQETIIAVFDTAAHAQAAARALEIAGFPANDINTFDSARLSSTAAGGGVRDVGLWQRLFGGDYRQQEAAAYARTVEGGGVVLTIRVPDSKVAQAMSVLNFHKPVDVRGRTMEAGTTTTTTTTTATAAAPIMSSSTAASAAAPAAPPAAPMAAAAAGPAVAQAARAAAEEVMRLAEEELNVTKRQIEAGMTRIRRFVTQKAVEAQVTLHEEHAEILRRGVTDPGLFKDIDWTDKVIEIVETAEEPVISKTAHVAEEVIIRREGSDRVETVHDTIRRQQVEVEHLASSGLKPAPGPQPAPAPQQRH